MINKRFKWIIRHCGADYFFIKKPKKIAGGYRVDGYSYISRDIRLIPRWVYDSL